jgi:O-antigen/teichoic acid export membrane protein
VSVESDAVASAQLPRDDRDGSAATARSETDHALSRMFGRDSIYVIVWGLQLGIAAICTPIATRLLTSSAFGTVAAAVAIMQLLVSIGSMSLQTAVQRQYQREDGDRQARRLVTLAIVVSAITFALAFSTGPLWCPLLRLGSFTTGPVHYAVIWAGFTAISNAVLGLLRSRDQLFSFGVVSLLQSVVAEALSLLLVAFVHASASEWVFGQMLAQGVAVVAALAMARPLAIRLRDARMLWDAVRYSGALMPAVVASFVLDAVDRLIIKHDLHSSDVARYAVGRNIGAIPLLLLGVLGTAWLPRLFALSHDDVRGAVLARTRDALFSLLLPVLVGLGAGAPLLLAIWVPASYNPAGLWLLVATISVTALPVAGMMTASWVLMARDRTLPVAACTGVAAVANVGLNVVLVPRLGIEGSALATIASYVILYALLARVANAEQPVPHPPGRLVGACLAAVGAALGFSQAPASPAFAVGRAIVVVVCLVAFASVLAELVAPGRIPRLARVARWARWNGAGA